MKKDKIKNFGIMFLLVMLTISIVTNIIFCCKIKHLKSVYTGEIKWEEKTDTSPNHVSETKTKVVSVPFVVVVGDKNKRSPPGTDTIYLSDKKDSAVNIQLTQKVYKDSNYVAYVSGFMQNLDSIKVIYQKISYSEMRPPGDIKSSPPKISLGAIGGVGYGFASKRFEPFIGFGISYKIY